MKQLAGENIKLHCNRGGDNYILSIGPYSIPGSFGFCPGYEQAFILSGAMVPDHLLNSEYIRKSSDRLLTFALEHEF